MSDYQDYLNSLHSKNKTPVTEIGKMIKRATKHSMISAVQIIAGEANEVYEVSLDNGKIVILRITRGKYASFARENWAINKVKSLGVPVPKMIFLADKYCVMEKIDGEPLERGKIDFFKLSKKDQRKYLNQAGEILAKIHSVKTNGFGELDSSGNGEFKNESKFLETYSKKNDLSSEILKAIEIIKNFDYPSDINLCHGDYANKHILVKDNEIVGIIDWGEARSDNFVYDFAYWDFWFGEDIPTRWIMEGYSKKNIFDSDFYQTLEFIKILKSLDTLGWYKDRGFQAGEDIMLLKLKKAISYFE